MNSNKVLKSASILFLLLPVLLLVTCKKDDSDNSGNGYRIIKSIYSLENVQVDSTLYEYQGDKMSLIHSFHYGQESSRSEIAYPDKNSMELLASFYYDSAWHVSYKNVFKLEGTKVTGIEIYNDDIGTLQLSSKQSFIYTNNNLTECVIYMNESGNWVPVDKTVYYYNVTQHYQSVNFLYVDEKWQENEKIEISYMGNQIDTIRYYTYEEGSYTEDGKIGFTCEGDLIMEYTLYSLHDGSWIEDESVQYTYDSNKNLASVTYAEGEYIEKIEYYYEQGNGNYEQLVDYYAYYLYGVIFPHPTKAADRDSIPIFFNLGQNSRQ